MHSAEAFDSQLDVSLYVTLHVRLHSGKMLQAPAGGIGQYQDGQPHARATKTANAISLRTDLDPPRMGEVLDVRCEV